MAGEHGFVLLFALIPHLEHSVRLQRVHSDWLLVGLIGPRREQNFFILAVCLHLGPELDRRDAVLVV